MVFFFPTCALAVGAFLAEGFGDINSRWAHLVPSDHDNGVMIHSYSFGKSCAQHWSQRCAIHQEKQSRSMWSLRCVPGVLEVGKSICLWAWYLWDITLFMPTLVFNSRRGWRSSYPRQELLQEQCHMEYPELGELKSSFWPRTRQPQEFPQCACRTGKALDFILGLSWALNTSPEHFIAKKVGINQLTPMCCLS